MAAELDAATLGQLLEAGADVQIVDVRPRETFEHGHIPGSVNIPFERLLEDIDSVEWGDRVVFVCPYGERSRQAATLLSAYEGVDETTVYNLTDGLLGWDGPLTQQDHP